MYKIDYNITKLYSRTIINSSSYYNAHSHLHFIYIIITNTSYSSYLLDDYYEDSSY